ncbi:MAG TPA: ATP synthase F0 subunit B [Myxococcota bacterium]|nr:ATP synthase F0 subunit B [Myxococcota bacterium]
MDLDVTLLFQIVLLAALMLVLERLLFRPLLRVIESRHQQIHGARHEVATLERLSAADREAYETRLREARRSAHVEREKLRQSGRDEARRLLGEVRADIAKAMQASRESIGAAERAAQQNLARDVDGLARQLVEKLLGRKVSA